MERKQTLSLCLALLLFLSTLLSACAPTNPPAEGTAAVTAPETSPETIPETAPETSPETAPETAPETTPETEPPVVYPLASRLRMSFPRTDGSTSTLPLDNAIREAICGPNYYPAKHTSTHTAFDNLLLKKADLIFSVPVSSEQLAKAEEAGVTLEQYAISKEAFVFVLNAENPVDSLTQDQLRDIYSGKITNWKEVGGDDAPITAFQRNEDSGSQNYIKVFMGDTPLMDAPSELRPTIMSGLMKAIAEYDNAKYSIGYSYYAYAANMYGTGTELKFAAVDGVYPDDTTISDDSYPLVTRNYVILRSDSGESARDLVEWLRTPEGQKIVEESGYFSELGKEAPVEESVLGTGPEMPETPLVLDRYYTAEWNPEGGSLKDKKVEEKINAVYRQLKDEGKESVETAVFNGYLVFYCSVDSRYFVRVFDLRTGVEITEVSDLFYKGTDFMNKIDKNSPGLIWHHEERGPVRYEEIEMSFLFGTHARTGATYDFSQLLNPLYFLPMTPDAMEGLWEDPSAVKVFARALLPHTAYRGERGTVYQFDEEDGLPAGERERLNRFFRDYVESEEGYARCCEVYKQSFLSHYQGAGGQSSSFLIPTQFKIYAVGYRYLQIAATVPQIDIGYLYFDFDTLQPLDKAPDLTGVFS